MIKIDDHGKPYYVDADGKKVVVPPQPSPNNIQFSINENGEHYIIDSNGVQRKVKLDAIGQPFYLSEDGKKI